MTGEQGVSPELLDSRGGKVCGREDGGCSKSRQEDLIPA